MFGLRTHKGKLRNGEVPSSLDSTQNQPPPSSMPPSGNPRPLSSARGQPGQQANGQALYLHLPPLAIPPPLPAGEAGLGPGPLLVRGDPLEIKRTVPQSQRGRRPSQPQIQPIPSEERNGTGLGGLGGHVGSGQNLGQISAQNSLQESSSLERGGGTNSDLSFFSPLNPAEAGGTLGLTGGTGGQPIAMANAATLLNRSQSCDTRNSAARNSEIWSKVERLLKNGKKEHGLHSEFGSFRSHSGDRSTLRSCTPPPRHDQAELEQLRGSYASFKVAVRGISALEEHLNFISDVVLQMDPTGADAAPASTPIHSPAPRAGGVVPPLPLPLPLPVGNEPQSNSSFVSAFSQLRGINGTQGRSRSPASLEIGLIQQQFRGQPSADWITAKVEALIQRFVEIEKFIRRNPPRAGSSWGPAPSDGRASSLSRSPSPPYTPTPDVSAIPPTHHTPPPLRPAPAPIPPALPTPLPTGPTAAGPASPSTGGSAISPLATSVLQSGAAGALARKGAPVDELCPERKYVPGLPPRECTNGSRSGMPPNP